MAKAISHENTQSYTIFNTIESSPINKIVLTQNPNEFDIGLYGTNGEHKITAREPHKLEYFLNWFKQQNKNDPIISPEMTEAIQNFHPENDKIKKEKIDLCYTKMEETVKQKLKQAQQENKKLLILIGDRDDNWDSGFLQLIALDICKKNNIQHFLAEAPKNFMHKPLSYGTDFWQPYMKNFNAPITLRAALEANMSLHAYDPLSPDWSCHKVTFRERAQSMHKTISKLNQNAICVTGTAHISDIMSDILLQSQYLTVTFQAQMVINSSESDIFLSRALDNEQKEVVKSIKDAHRNANIEHLIKKKESIDDELIQLNFSNAYSIAHKKDDAISPNEEIIILPIKEEYEFKPGKSTSFIRSDINALDIAIDTISKHNPDLKTLNALKNTKSLVKNIHDLLFTCPSYIHKFCCYAQLLLNPNYKLPKDCEKLGNVMLKHDAHYFKNFSSTLTPFLHQEKWNDFDDLFTTPDYYPSTLTSSRNQEEPIYCDYLLYNVNMEDTVYPKE